MGTNPMLGKAPNFSPEYVSVLHDLATAYHDKLSELLPPSEVEAFRVSTADKILRNLGLKYADNPTALSQVSDLLDKWGMRLRVNESQGQVHCGIDCPYAHVVHPLYSNPTFCPISTMVLGAVRSNRPNARLVSVQLTDEGTEFRIEE